MYLNFSFNTIEEMQRQGGVHNLLMRREEMDGANLRDGIVEVAFEQWTEQRRYRQRQVGFNVILRYRGTVSVLIMDARTGRAQRNFSLNLGGNTDDTFALSIRCSGFFFIIDWYWKKKEV